jgi:energy-coupling factor transporter transmembrane protein EcfT
MAIHVQNGKAMALALLCRLSHPRHNRNRFRRHRLKIVKHWLKALVLDINGADEDPQKTF